PPAERVEHAAGRGLRVGHVRTGLADALDEPPHPVVGRVEVDDLVLEARRSGVEHEDARAHAPAPCAWIAVTAMVLTMSRTRAPRERSLTGLFSPWSTGPTASAPAERCT